MIFYIYLTIQYTRARTTNLSSNNKHDIIILLLLYTISISFSLLSSRTPIQTKNNNNNKHSSRARRKPGDRRHNNNKNKNKGKTNHCLPVLAITLHPFVIIALPLRLSHSGTPKSYQTIEKRKQNRVKSNPIQFTFTLHYNFVNDSK